MTHEGAVLAALPQTEASKASAEWPFNVGLVYLADMLVDDEYQRPPALQFIAEGAATFDETLVGCLDVNERKNGSLAILDGQQRYRMMAIVGKTTCYASIYNGMTLADEAGFFYRKNKDRRNMSPYYGFRARTVAGDPEAIEIRMAVEAQGFVLSSSSNDREAIGAIRAVETVWTYSSQYREEALTPTLMTLRDSVMGRKDSLSSWLIMGIGRFWQSYADEEVERDKLSGVILPLGPTSLLGMARDRQAVTSASSGRPKSSMPWTIARLLAEEYNRSIRGSRRGDFQGKLDMNRLGY